MGGAEKNPSLRLQLVVFSRQAAFYLSVYNNNSQIPRSAAHPSSLMAAHSPAFTVNTAVMSPSTPMCRQTILLLNHTIMENWGGA